MNLKFILSTLLIIAVIIPTSVLSCTIFCGKDTRGQMWAGNNEDFYWFDFSTQIRIVPKTDSTLSYLYFNYHKLDFAQGGVNEAGLFFDANMVEASDIRDAEKKIPYPGGTGELAQYMLGHCKTVPEVLALFEKYKVPELRSAQIHLADKAGNKGLITADSSWLTLANFQVSTNYNLNHHDDDYKKCWRYPIAFSMLSHADPDLELMTRICDSTSQRQGVSTIYSNVHNLTTGEMWLYYAWDYKNPYKTTLEELTALGDTVIMIRDLFADQTVVKAYNAFSTKDFSAGLEILNTIGDPALREEKLKLLSQGALFEFDEFIESESVAITKDEQLIRQIIEASSNAEILSSIANQNVSKTNKNLAEQKIRTIQKSGMSNTLILGLMLAGGILIFLVFVRNKIIRRQLVE